MIVGASYVSAAGAATSPSSAIYCITNGINVGMFAVKATYKGETRKFSLSTDEFPTFEQLCNHVCLSKPAR